MNMSIEKMLSHVYEIEGLMLVTRRLGEENTPDVITNKIHRKVRELAEMCGIDLTQEPAQNVPDAAVPTAAQSEPEAVPEEHLPEDDYDADETWQHDNGEEFKEVFTLDYQEPKHTAVEPEQVPVADREPDEDITVEFIEAEEPVEAPVEPQSAAVVQPPVFRMPEDTSDEPVPEPDPEVLPEAEDEPDITVEFIEAQDERLPEPEDEMPVPPTPTDFPEPEEPSAPLRVDEKLQRSLSKDIRKAFSINDRFRFQRELFAGSANAMNTAIEHIEMMNSYGNAELYFFSQLNWDRENETVQDFMAIVRNHFQK
ncbi:MAG: hypothetical protein IJV05_07620 [Muribaculaceae bacterium]|nr:hypothetical protein [Muribaculaceae bacterium]